MSILEKKLYPKFLFIWLGILVSLVLTPLGAGFVVQALSLVSLGLVLYGMFGLREVCARFEKAFFYQAASVALMVVVLVLTFIGGDLEAMSDFMAILFSLCVMGSGIFSILADYFLFWGMDEIILPRGYVFPARRIRWCFYLSIIGAFAAAPFMLTASTLLPTLILMGFSLAQLVLFFRYLQAVQARESSPLKGE